MDARHHLSRYTTADCPSVQLHPRNGLGIGRSENMVRKKKTEEERTCDNCAYGPVSEECEDCEHLDQWSPKKPACDGDSCKVSVNGGPEVPFPSKEATEQVTEMVKEHLEDQGVILKKPKQLDLEGKPLPTPEVQEDESTEIKTYALYYSNGLKFRMGEEALDKALELKKKESVNDRKDRIKLLVQNRSKVISGNKPLDPDRWDAGTKAIYERIMVGHGREP